MRHHRLNVPGTRRPIPLRVPGKVLAGVMATVALASLYSLARQASDPARAPDPTPAPVARPSRSVPAVAAPAPPGAPVVPDAPVMADTAPPAATATATATATASDAEAPAGDTMFLTIIGNQTFVAWGYAGDRPPRYDVGADGVALATSRAVESVAVQPGAGRVIEQAPAALLQAEMNSPDFRPLGPAPLDCPRTLPAGSDQATADALRSQFGCRYLASCATDTECAWYYQGRG